MNVPGLGLVGVADQVVRAPGLARDGVPLAPHREGGAAAPDDARVHDLADDALGTELDRAPQGVVAAVGAVVVEALRIDRADAAQQAQARIALLGRRGRRRLGRRAAGEDLDDGAGVDERQLALERRVAGLGQQRGGRAVALAQARAAQPGGAVDVGVLGAEALLDLRDERLGARAAAGHVVADVDHARRALLGREERVERRHAVDVGRRHGEPLGDVVQPSRADPPGALVQRVQRRQQHVALRAGGMAAVGGVPVVDRVGARPRRQRRTQEGVDGVALHRRGLGVEQPQVHRYLPRPRCWSRLQSDARGSSPPGWPSP